MRSLAAPTVRMPTTNRACALPRTRGIVCRTAAPLTSPAPTPTVTGPPRTTSVASPATIDDFKVDKRPVILYDGVCNLCNAAVDFMLTHDTKGNFRLAALQSSAGARLLARVGRPGDMSSIVVVEENEHHIQSGAVLRVAKDIDQPWPLLAIVGQPIPGFLRDTLYDIVADNRYSIMGERNACRLSNRGFEDRFIVE